MFAQCETFGNHPKGEQYAKSLMVYRDFIKAKEYEKALSKWKELYQYCKGANSNILRDGVKIYKYLAENSDHISIQNQYLDTVSKLYLEQIECYGDIIRPKTNKPWAGIFYYYLGRNYYNLQDYQNAFVAFQKSIAIDSFQAHYGIIYPFAKATLEEFQADRISKIDVQNIRKRLIEIADYNIDKDNNISEYFDQKSAAESLWFNSGTGKQVFDCDFFADEIRALYIEDRCLRYQEHRLIADFFFETRIDCNEQTKIYQELVDRHNHLPVRELGCGIGRDDYWRATNSLQDDDYECAKKHYIKVLTNDLANGHISNEKKYKASIRLASIFAHDKEWENALKYYEYAATLEPNSGAPYLKIGLLYLRANTKCSGIERQLVVSVCFDYFEKAVKFEDTKEDALEKLKTYRKYLPTKAEFLEQYPNYTKQTMEVGCELKKEARLRFRE